MLAVANIAVGSIAIALSFTKASEITAEIKAAAVSVAKALASKEGKGFEIRDVNMDLKDPTPQLTAVYVTEWSDWKAIDDSVKVEVGANWYCARLSSFFLRAVYKANLQKNANDDAYHVRNVEPRENLRSIPSACSKRRSETDHVLASLAEFVKKIVEAELKDLPKVATNDANKKIYTEKPASKKN